MKRGMWFALLAVMAAVLVVGGMAMAGDDDNYGPGWRHGPGMMWGGGFGGGYGPGMMGGGFGSGMMGFGMGPAISQLPAEKQDQLRKLQVTTEQSMVALRSDIQAKADALREALTKFPVDQAAAKKAHEAVDKIQDQMFSLHLNTLAQAQQIVGKETWDKLHADGYGPGAGRGWGHGPGMMGPGGRGPNW